MVNHGVEIDRALVLDVSHGIGFNRDWPCRCVLACRCRGRSSLRLFFPGVAGFLASPFFGLGSVGGRTRPHASVWRCCSDPGTGA